MHTKNDNRIKWKLCILAVTAMLTLSACGAGGDQTPTPGIEAIYTAAAQTIAAQQATLQAQIPPTTTPSPTLFPTLAPATTQPSLFGSPSPTSAAGGGAVGCDNSIYVSDVTIPDGTTMTPGQTFTKTWKVQNNGTCPWSTSYKLTFVTGAAMGGTSAAVPGAVQAGQQGQLSVDLTAPTAPGNYTGNWRMQNDKGEFFGTYLTVVITVSSVTATAPTATTAPATSTPETPTATP